MKGRSALALLVQLALLRRRRLPVLRPALAGATALVFYRGMTAPALATAITPPDGDLNGDHQVDAGDVRILLQIPRFCRRVGSPLRASSPMGTWRR